MEKRLNSVCVYCGSSPGDLPVYLESAREVGMALADQGIRLIYGGGNVGLMGAVADGALEHSGEVIGIIPSKIVDLEVAHEGLTRLEIVDTMHERKNRMAELSDAFLALPGGIGTIEEIFEAYTWTQLGYHNKPCGLLNISGYFNSLIDFMKHMCDSKFLREEHYETLIVENDINSMLEKLEQAEPVQIEKWVK